MLYKTNKISTEQLIPTAKAFNALHGGGVNASDRTNFDIEELGFSVQVVRNVNRYRVPVCQAVLSMIQNSFMAALREAKKEIDNNFTTAKSLAKYII